MLDTKYIYGDDVEPSVWKSMKYIDVLNLKIHLSDIAIARLLVEPLETRDFNRVNSCVNAMSFNRKLIKELNE